MCNQLPSSALSRIAHFQNRRDEVPNQELAKELAETKDRVGIQAIADNLWNKNRNVQSDCLKVLYEIGYIAPDLIADYVDDFLKLLKSRNNRMVWGAMIGLATIADRRTHEIWEQIGDVISAVEEGTLITVVSGIKTLATVAASNEEYNQRIFPILIRYLKTCIPRDVPMHAESILCAVDEGTKEEFLSVLDSRRPELTSAQLARLKKALKAVGAPHKKP